MQVSYENAPTSIPQNPTSIPQKCYFCLTLLCSTNYISSHYLGGITPPTSVRQFPRESSLETRCCFSPGPRCKSGGTTIACFWLLSSFTAASTSLSRLRALQARTNHQSSLHSPFFWRQHCEHPQLDLRDWKYQSETILLEVLCLHFCGDLG